jgi:nucleotide-binding universal stress UspA family protein
MIETVLIAVEDNESRMRSVVEHAAEIADALSARVVLYHVYEPEAFENLLSARDMPSADPGELARQNATVEAAATALKEAGVDFSVEASTGEPAEELTSYIGSHDIDHVFVGGRNRSPAGKALLGSVSQQIMVGTDVPCTLVR